MKRACGGSPGGDKDGSPEWLIALMRTNARAVPCRPAEAAPQAGKGNGGKGAAPGRRAAKPRCRRRNQACQPVAAATPRSTPSSTPSSETVGDDAPVAYPEDARDEKLIHGREMPAAAALRCCTLVRGSTERVTSVSTFRDTH